MELTPEKSLQVLAVLINRAPLSEAEAIGASSCVDIIEKAFKELKDFKNPPKPVPTD
jgi:hypothetical protein